MSIERTIYGATLFYRSHNFTWNLRKFFSSYGRARKRNFQSKMAWVNVENGLLLHVFYNVFIVATFNLASLRIEMKLSTEWWSLACALYACVDYVADQLQTILNFFFFYFYDWLCVRCCCHFCLAYGTKLVIHYIFVTLQLHALPKSKNDTTKE